MQSRHLGHDKTTNKITAATSATVAVVLALTYPAVPAKVSAEGNGYDWVKHADHDLLNGYYSSVASSADGSQLLAAVNDGGEGFSAASPLYASGDYGVTWENISNDVEDNFRNYWTSVDISNDGQKMVAASDYRVDLDGFFDDSGKIFITADGGDSWNDISPSEDRTEWSNIAISGDGTTIAALADDDNGNVYISEDSGATWETSPVEHVNNWDSVSISDDGSTVLVGGENTTSASSFVYISDNSADSWDDISPAPNGLGFTTKTTISDDGSKIAVSVYGYDSDEFDTVYLSENNGASWTDISPDDSSDNYWDAIAISGNGSVLSVLDDNDRMYVSYDDGSSWTLEEPGAEDDDTNNWNTVDMNTTGSRIIAASNSFAYSGYDDSITDDVQSDGSMVNLANAETGKALRLVTPEGTTITCNTPVKESGLNAQDGAYAYPLGLVDFCFSGADVNNGVSVIFVTDLKANQVTVRKYNPNNNSYGTITDAVVTETNLNGQPALQVSYNIVDNGPLDTDPDVGEIADPVGLATLEVGAPNTGVQNIQDILFVRQD